MTRKEVSVDHLAGGFAGTSKTLWIEPMPTVSVDHLAGGFAGFGVLSAANQRSECRSITWPADSPADISRQTSTIQSTVSVDHLAGGFAGVVTAIGQVYGKLGVGRSLGRRIRRRFRGRSA